MWGKERYEDPSLLGELGGDETHEVVRRSLIVTT